MRHGIRISGVHAAGDRGIDAILDLFLELQRDGVPMEKLRPNLDHCTMLSGANIRKAQEVKGMMFSCAPKYILGNAQRAAEIWDREVAHNWVVPVRSLLDAGVKVAWEVDTGEDFGPGAGSGEGAGRGEGGFPVFHPMFQMQLLATRKGADGNTWGPKQAIDRRTALIMMTRRGAEYMLREDRLGSIEPGKLADLVVFDGDWLAAPDNRLVDLAALMTFVGGRVVYADPSFAEKVGPSLTRVQHRHAARYPAYRPTADLHQWADGKQ